MLNTLPIHQVSGQMKIILHGHSLIDMVVSKAMW